MNDDEPQPGALLRALLALPVGERAGRVRAGGDVAAQLTTLVDEVMNLTSTDATAAIDAAEAVTKLAEDLDDPLTASRAQHARARALSYVGRFDDALAACRDATVIATRHGHTVEAGRAQLASMHALGELGRNDEAIAAGEQARALFESVDADDFAARADINLGIVHLRRDQPDLALDYLDRARPRLEHEPELLGHIENSRGEALVAVNDFAAAEDAFLSALAAFEEAGSTLTAAIAESNLADLASRQGRLDRALYFFEGARRHFERVGSPAHLARLLAEQAEAKGVLGLPEDALEDYQSALIQLDQCGLALESARARCSMGLVLLRLARPVEAETALAAAATAFDELGHVTARATVDLVRAELALQNARLPEARRMATRALAAVADRPADAATARHLLARIGLAEGDTETAEADLTAALAAARRLDLAPLLADILDTRGRVYRRRGELGRAIADLTRSLQAVERVRGALQADRFRAAFLGQRTQTHEALFESILDHEGERGTAEAFAVAEQAKSRSLLDQVHAGLAVTAPHGADATTTALEQEWQQCQAALNALYSRLGDHHAFEADEAWTAAVRAQERALEAAEARLAARGRSPVTLGTRATLTEVQAGLGPNATVIEYFVTGDALTIFVVDRDGATVTRHAASVDAVMAALHRLQFQIDRALRPGALVGARAGQLRDDARRALGALYDQLVRPIEGRLRATRASRNHRTLTIVPHGPLHLVPFAALWNGEQHLVEDFDVHAVPSASLLLHLQRDQRPVTGTPLLVAVADEQAPRIDEEATRLAKLLRLPRSRLLRGAEATRERLRTLAPTASLLHLAVHGRFLTNAPAGSGLRLSDGWLNAREVARLPLDADFVTLSGCETGLNRVDAGDELLGLQRSFLAAGAKTLLVSLWRVDDEQTARFMDRLYSGCHDWLGTPGARVTHVAATQRALIANDLHPAIWAAFTLVGRP
ncbi:MAG: CHAT domain-containing protein [Phycisphaerales bacterium]|nr:CHAT domain-containing protein [Phycisphaerales bacterium]